MASLFSHQNIQRLWLMALLVFPIVLWILPSDFFDGGRVVLCPSRLLFDIECYGCGMTRAIMHLHHFEIADALYFNMLSFITYPFLVYVWLKWTAAAVAESGWAAHLPDRLVKILSKLV